MGLGNEDDKGWRKGGGCCVTFVVSRNTKERMEGEKGAVATFSWDVSNPCCSVATMFEKEGKERQLGARVVSESVPSPPSNPSFLRLLHMLTRKCPSPRG